MKCVCFSPPLCVVERAPTSHANENAASITSRASDKQQRPQTDGRRSDGVGLSLGGFSLPPLSIKSPTPKLTPQRAGKRFLHGGMPLCVLWCTYAPYFTRHRQVGGSGGQHGFENFPITFTAYSYLLSVLPPLSSRLISFVEETNDLWRGREEDAYLASSSLMDTQAAASASAA